MESYNGNMTKYIFIIPIILLIIGWFYLYKFHQKPVQNTPDMHDWQAKGYQILKGGDMK